jgi:ferric-dicitrate binding protein FerR (iron transport regulator)
MSQDIEQKTRELLEESTTRFDGRTLSRLTQARHAALDQARRPVRRRWNLILPAGAAAAAVLAVFMWAGGPKPEPSPVDDMEMLVDSDAAVFAEGDDLEFYEWAADESET